MNTHKVLVVCHGNICRSPLAAEVITSAGLDTKNRGLSEVNGKPAAKKIREYALTKGYDLTSHRSSSVSQKDVDWATIILYMDNGNKKRLEKFPGAMDKAICLGKYIGKQKIQDPNFMSRGQELTNLLDEIVQASLEVSRWLNSI